MSEDMPGRMPEDMPDRMPEDMPDRMPEGMPDSMPDKMSDRMPEDLPVTKCINVMVGITRSKVIFELLFLTGILPYISCLPSPGCISTVISGQFFSAACLPACCWLACWLVACELASLPDCPSLLGLDCLLVCLPACLLICLPFWLKVCQWEMLQCSFQSANVLFVMSAKHGVPCKRHRAMTSPFSRGAVCLRVLLPWALLQWLYAPVVLLFSMSRNSIMCQ